MAHRLPSGRLHGVETAEARKVRATERKDSNRISAQQREAQRALTKPGRRRRSQQKARARLPSVLLRHRRMQCSRRTRRPPATPSTPRERRGRDSSRGNLSLRVRNLPGCFRSSRTFFQTDEVDPMIVLSPTKQKTWLSVQGDVSVRD